MRMSGVKRAFGVSTYNCNGNGSSRTICACAQTAAYHYALTRQGAAKIFLATHLGRPDGKVLKRCARRRFGSLQNAGYHHQYRNAEKFAFNPGEESNDPAFRRELASKADIFVDDAFADCHRGARLYCGCCKLLPAYAGLLL